MSIKTVKLILSYNLWRLHSSTSKKLLQNIFWATTCVLYHRHWGMA